MSNKEKEIKQKTNILLDVKLKTVEKHLLKQYFKECYDFLLEKEDYETLAKLEKRKLNL